MKKGMRQSGVVEEGERSSQRARWRDAVRAMPSRKERVAIPESDLLCPARYCAEYRSRAAVMSLGLRVGEEERGPIPPAFTMSNALRGRDWGGVEVPFCAEAARSSREVVDESMMGWMWDVQLVVREIISRDCHFL